MYLTFQKRKSHSISWNFETHHDRHNLDSKNRLACHEHVLLCIEYDTICFRSNPIQLMLPDETLSWYSNKISKFRLCCILMTARYHDEYDKMNRNCHEIELNHYSPTDMVDETICDRLFYSNQHLPLLICNSNRSANVRLC